MSDYKHTKRPGNGMSLRFVSYELTKAYRNVLKETHQMLRTFKCFFCFFFWANLKMISCELHTGNIGQEINGVYPIAHIKCSITSSINDAFVICVVVLWWCAWVLGIYINSSLPQTSRNYKFNKNHTTNIKT